MNYRFSMLKLLYVASAVFIIFCALIILVTLYPLKDSSFYEIGNSIRYYLEPIKTTFLLALSAGILVVIIALLTIIAYRLINPKVRKVVAFFLVLPLIFPPYIASIIYIDIFKSPLGIVLIGRSALIEFWQAVFVLSFFLYPYSFLLLKNRREMIDLLHEKILSLYDLSIFAKLKILYIPHLKGAVFSSFLLVAMYIFADFGAVSILRIDTVTTELYQTMVKKFDYSEGALLSLILLCAAFFSMALGSKFTGRPTISFQSPRLINSAVRRPLISRILAWGWILALIIFTVIIPTTKLLIWFAEFLKTSSTLKNIWFDQSSFAAMVANSVSIALLVTVATQLSALLFQSARFDAKITAPFWIIQKMMTMLYALPAIVIVFGILVIKHQSMIPTVNSMIFVLLSYYLRYGGIAFLTLEPAIDAIPRQYIRIGSTYLKSYLQRVRQIIFPYVRSYLFQSSNYLYIQTLRELTIPLILLPLGFQVLSVRIWQTASEGLYQYSSPMILVLLMLSLPSLVWYIKDQI